MLDQIPSQLALPIFVFGFGFLIFIHELGHFLVAKWAGVHCTQFAIGFGQALVSYRKGMGFRVGSTEPSYYERIEAHLHSKGQEPSKSVRVKEKDGTYREVKEYASNQVAEAAADLQLGETEYRLNWVPLGGYVKMVGQEDLDPTATSDDPRAFNQQPFWPRAAIISAGVTMNAIFAVLFFICAFMAGVEFPPAIIGNVIPNSAAATTAAESHPDEVGLRTGDRVTKVNGKAPNDFTDLQIAAALAGPGETVDLEIERPGIDDRMAQQLHFVLMPVSNEKMDGIRGIGVTPANDIQLVNTQTAQHNPPIADEYKKYGLSPNMILSKVNGHPVTAYWQYKHYVDTSKGQPIEMVFDPAPATDGEPSVGAPVTVSATPPTTEMMGGVNKVPLNFLGLVPTVRADAVLEDGPAARGGMVDGDVIVQVEGTRFPSYEQLVDVIRANDGMPLSVIVKRGEEEKTLKITPREKLIGVALERTMNISGVLDKSPFAGLNLAQNSTLKAINGTAVDNFRDARVAIEADTDGVFDATFHVPVGDGSDETDAVTLDDSHRAALANLGWAEPLPGSLFRQLQQPVKADNVLHATKIGLEKTRDFIAQTYLTLAGLFQRTIPVKALRGPVGITHVGTQVTERGLPWLMYFLGLISINLAVINFLPLPIVDGGLFLLLCIEKLRGRPVSVQVQQAITLAGIVLLGTLFLVITFYDIQRLAG